MNSANNKRKFPTYTTEQLKAAIAEGTATQAIKDEVAARESGQSIVFVVPQIVPFRGAGAV